MAEVKVAIPYEMAETIRDYCGVREGCEVCIFLESCGLDNDCDPAYWDLGSMRVEGKDNG